MPKRKRLDVVNSGRKQILKSAFTSLTPNEIQELRKRNKLEDQKLAKSKAPTEVKFSSLVNYSDEEDASNSNSDTELTQSTPNTCSKLKSDLIIERVNKFLQEMKQLTGIETDTSLFLQKEEKEKKSSNPLQRGDWKQCLDKESGDFYYWNIVTQEVTWDVPLVFQDEPLATCSSTTQDESNNFAMDIDYEDEENNNNNNNNNDDVNKISDIVKDKNTEDVDMDVEQTGAVSDSITKVQIDNSTNKSENVHDDANVNTNSTSNENENSEQLKLEISEFAKDLNNCLQEIMQQCWQIAINFFDFPNAPTFPTYEPISNYIAITPTIFSSLATNLKIIQLLQLLFKCEEVLLNPSYTTDVTKNAIVIIQIAIKKLYNIALAIHNKQIILDCRLRDWDEEKCTASTILTNITSIRESLENIHEDIKHIKRDIGVYNKELSTILSNYATFAKTPAREATSTYATTPIIRPPPPKRRNINNKSAMHRNKIRMHPHPHAYNFPPNFPVQPSLPPPVDRLAAYPRHLINKWNNVQSNLAMNNLSPEAKRQRYIQHWREDQLRSGAMQTNPNFTPIKPRDANFPPFMQQYQHPM